MDSLLTSIISPASVVFVGLAFVVFMIMFFLLIWQNVPGVGESAL